MGQVMGHILNDLAVPLFSMKQRSSEAYRVRLPEKCLNPSHLLIVDRGRSQRGDEWPIVLADRAHEHRDVVDFGLRDLSTSS
jgi:hypothetical protein